jgi:DNA-binding MarR family transcriptional regulator
MNPKRLFASIAAKNRWELSDAELSIMCILSAEGPKRPRDLALKIGITSAGVHSASKTLLGRRIIRKKRNNKHDERAVEFTLLEYGNSMMQSIIEGIPDYENKAPES